MPPRDEAGRRETDVAVDSTMPPRDEAGRRETDVRVSKFAERPQWLNRR
jgi:hypothetical protein